MSRLKKFRRGRQKHSLPCDRCKVQGRSTHNKERLCKKCRRQERP